MRMRMSYPRASTSLVLALAIATAFTLRSFAAPEASRAAGPAFAQDCTGTLTVSAGQVTINGNAAQTGATVMSGSAIATGSNGKAIIDLGPAGRVELGENTSITLTCVAGSLAIRSGCGKTEVEVRRGALDVKTPKTESLAAGKKETYEGAFDATSSGAVDVKVECEGRKAGGGPVVGRGLVGLLVIIGVGAAIATGVAVSRNEGSALPSSPVTP